MISINVWDETGMDQYGKSYPLIKKKRLKMSRFFLKTDREVFYLPITSQSVPSLIRVTKFFPAPAIT